MHVVKVVHQAQGETHASQVLVVGLAHKVFMQVVVQALFVKK